MRSWRDAAVALIFAGCTGSISGEPPAPAAAREPAAPAAAAPKPQTPQTSPPPSTMHVPSSSLQRLSQRQLSNSLRDLFGDAAVSGLVFETDVVIGGFASVGGREVGGSKTGVRLQDQAARTLAGRMISDPVARARWVTCQPSRADDVACARSFVRAVGRRLFRRPLTDAETIRFTDVATTSAKLSGDFWTGAEDALTGLLLSPKFLHLVERGQPEGNVSRLTDHELAARLSYLLWATTPDEALLAAADAGELTRPGRLKTVVARLLADKPRLTQGVQAFVEGHVSLHLLDAAEKDRTRYPQATAALKLSMRQALLELAREVAVERDAPFLSILDPGIAYVDPLLAPLYGMPIGTLKGMARIDLSADGLRVGLLTEPALLAATARESETSPTLRGLLVNELLCVHVPAPPADVMTALPARPQGLSRRAQLEAHMNDPRCSSCHQLMDPIGFGLEAFDAIGAVQTSDAGRPVNVTGRLGTQPFNGPREMSRLVQADPRALRCLVARLLSHALGRRPVDQDAAVIDRLVHGQSRHGGRLKALLGELVEDELFLRAPSL